VVKPRPAAQPVFAPEPAPSAEDCDPVSLKPAYVPDGFDDKPKEGPGGGIPSDAWPGDAVHYQGPDAGSHITVTLLGDPEAIPENHLDGEAIAFEGGSGTLGSTEDGFSVEAIYEEGGQACDTLWIVAYGILGDELRSFAESLTSSGSGSPSQRCPRPSFRPTYVPPGISRRARPGSGPWDPMIGRTDHSAIHFLGPDLPADGFPSGAAFIEISRFASGSLGDLHEEVHGPVRVLGSEGEIGSGYLGGVVTYRYGSDRCNLYSIVTPGISVTERQLARFAEGLREA
jgi:hypothetical protein